MMVFFIDDRQRNVDAISGEGAMMSAELVWRNRRSVTQYILNDSSS